MAVRIDLDVDGRSLEVSGLRGRFALGEPFRIDVEAFVRAAPPEAASLLGRPCVVALTDAFGQRLVVHGVALEVARTVATLSGASFAIAIGPALAALGVGADRRVFQDLAAHEIVADVLARGGVAARFALVAPPHRRPYTVQYGESDLDLVTRLCAEEGITLAFDLDEDATTVALVDDTTAAGPIAGGLHVRFADDDALAATTDAVLRVARRRALRSDAVTLRDHDVAHPALVVEGRARRDAGALEVYDAPARATSPDVIARRATRRLEAIACDRDVVSGRASGVRLVPGRAMVIEGHPCRGLDAPLLVRSVDLRVTLARHGAAHDVEIAWDAIPLATPWRPPPARATRSPGGPQSGVVVGPPGREIHPDDQGRVRVQHRWDRLGARDATASTWMRVAQAPLSGAMMLPRVGWDVLVGHDADDVDAPFVIAHLHDGEHPPPYPLPANATRTAWGTSTTPGGGSKNELRFEDGAGREGLAITASGDHVVVVANALEEKIGADESLTVGGSSTMTVGGATKQVVAGSERVVVGGSESHAVGASRVVEVAGAESTVVGGARAVTAIAGSTIDAQGGRSLVVGGSLVGATAAAIGRSTLGSAAVTIGGAHVVPAGAGISTVTVGVAAETIGGAKIEVAGSSHAVTGKAALAVTVGAAAVVAAGGNVGETSAASLAVTVGGAFVGNAAEVSVEGETEIVVRAGAATITVRPGSVEVQAPAIGLPSGGIDAGGSTVEHN